MSDESEVTWVSIGRDRERQAEINKADHGRYAIAEVSRLRKVVVAFREVLNDAVIAAYIEGATAVHEFWKAGGHNSEADFTEAAHDYAKSVIRP